MAALESFKLWVS